MTDDGTPQDRDSEDIDPGLPVSRRGFLATTGVAGLGLAGTPAVGAHPGSGQGSANTLEGLVDAAELPPLFDCNAWVGETEVNPIAFRLYRPSPELGDDMPEATDLPGDLIDEMDRTGVDRALTYHITARTEDAKAGNDQLMQDIAGYRRLEPAWVASPDGVADYGGASAFVDAMESAGVGAVRMFPGEWSWMHPGEEDWELTDPAMEPVLEALAEVQAVVVLDSLSKRSGGFSFSELEDVCRTHETTADGEPGLSVILTQHFPPVDVPDGPMVEAVRNTDNLYAGTTRFQEFQGVREFVDLVGDDRFVFGTHWPHSSIGASLGTVMQSRLTGDERRQVGWENVAGLLADSPSSLGSPGRGRRRGRGNPGNGGMIAPGGSAGRGRGFGADETQYKTVPYGIVDMHGHEYGNGDATVSEMDLTGIDLCVVSNTGGSPASNDVVANAADRYPDRLIPAAYADGDWSDVRGELERCFDDLGMRIIKLHPDYAPDHPVYDPVYEFANEREALVVPHAQAGDDEIQAWKDVADGHPNMTLMLYHAARSWPEASKYASVVHENDNALLEITYSYVIDGLVAHLIDLVGAEKVFFGTDMGYRAPQSQVAWAAYEPLTPEERRLHMRENGLRLLDDLGALPDAYADEV